MILTTPSIHMNGTSRDALLEGFIDAGHAVRRAMDELCKNAPNGRDYYPQGDGATHKAIAEHRDRLTRLQSVYNELQTLAEAVAD